MKTVPLIEAVISNDTEKVADLINRRVDVNEQDQIGFTALHYAAQNYSLDIARLLLSKSASVDIRDVHGNTPLFKAVFESNGRGDMIRLLLECGADRDSANNYGISPLELSKTISNYQVSQFFD